MNNQEYEQKKRECWEEYKQANLVGEVQWQPVSRYDVFCDAFDRAFALGKQFGNSEQVDAEGEEMLTVSRKRVREMYAANERIKADFPDKETAHISDHINHVLKHLFGSKCLPDNVESSEPNVDSSEPNVDSLPQNPTENCDNKSHISADCNKPAEPKFKEGDKVRYIPSGQVYEIEYYAGYERYHLKGWLTDICADDLKPYTEPKEGASLNVNNSDINIDEIVAKGYVPDPTKHFDTILKDGFRNEMRLNIATQICTALIGNQDLADRIMSADEDLRSFAHDAYIIADTLIAEVEKGAER